MQKFDIIHFLAVKRLPEFRHINVQPEVESQDSQKFRRFPQFRAF